MSDGKVTINRTLVGLISLGCLGASGVLFFAGTDQSDNVVMGAGAGAAFFRVGLLMGALWLALPSKGRDAAWANASPTTLLGIFLAIFGIGFRPRVAVPFLLLLGVIGYFVRPRGKYRPPRDQ